MNSVVFKKPHFPHRFVSCVVLCVIAALTMTGCASGNEIELKDEYRKAIDNKQIVEAITLYYTTWGEALKEAKESNDIYAFCNYSESLSDLYSRISTDLSDSVYMSNQSLIALYYDITSFHELPLIVDVGKAYEDIMHAVGLSYGHEGLSQIILSLNLLPEEELGFESINSMNEIIIDAYSGKFTQITELYFK